METGSIFEALAVSVGLGLLVGLQRERAGSKLAGVRTFPLVTMLGTICALLDRAMQSGWATPTGLVAVAGVTAMANFLLLRQDGHRDAGTTTEVALLVMYAAGAFAAMGPKAVALAVGVVVAVLLQAKGRLHGLAARIGDKDILAILQFAAITFVVLPVLPDRTFGPLDVLNPRNIWMMVVLVVGMSLAGYVAYKLMGANAVGSPGTELEFAL